MSPKLGSASSFQESGLLWPSLAGLRAHGNVLFVWVPVKMLTTGGLGAALWGHGGRWRLQLPPLLCMARGLPRW